MPARIFAAVIGLSSLAGIGLEWSTLLHNGHTPLAAAWILLRYFTILTNGLVAVVFLTMALRDTASVTPKVLGGTVAAIVLVGVVFALLLQNTRTLAGATATADFLLHRLAPILALVFWLLFAEKGRLGWRDPPDWSLYPLAYLIYALIRGSMDGLYAYPFIDVAANGWPQVILTAAIIAVGFIAAGEALVWIDGLLARRRR